VFRQGFEPSDHLGSIAVGLLVLDEITKKEDFPHRSKVFFGKPDLPEKQHMIFCLSVQLIIQLKKKKKKLQ
jgi:hypothetical protein